MSDARRDYAINVLYTTAARLRAMCNGDDWDLGLREAAAFIEFAVVPEVRDSPDSGAAAATRPPSPAAVPGKQSGAVS